jgi:primosomal protein N'
MNQGWQCPNCGKAHAPWMPTCDSELVTMPATGTNICDHEWQSDTAGTYCPKCGTRTNVALFAGVPDNLTPQ